MNASELKQAFCALGLCKGMKLIVHSSLKSFGHVEGGADTVIDVLMEILTPEGTLVMPSFNHEAPYQEGGIFDVRSTPTVSGIIPEIFWRRPGVLRSMNPTHPFAAWGANAERYTADHQKTSALGDDSPLCRLKQDGGYCLLIGVDYNRNTFHHHVECNEGVPCLRLRGEVYPVINAKGERELAHTWSWRNGRCPITDLNSYGPLMASVHRQAKIGNSLCKLYRLSEGYAVIAKALREGVGENPPCSGCSLRPRVTPRSITEVSEARLAAGESVDSVEFLH